MKSYRVLIQIKSTEQYFPVVLFFFMCKKVLTFESVDEILRCGQSNEILTWEYLYLSAQQHEISNSATFNVNFVITLNEH